jgi:hypothetical protein
MSAQQLRLQAQQRKSRSRKEALTSVCIGVALFLVFGWSAARAHDPVVRLGWVVLSVSALYVGRQLHKWTWPGSLPEDATPQATLTFHRALLQRRLEFDLHIWRRSGVPFLFLGIAIVLGPPIFRSPELSVRAAPFFVLLLGWLAAFYPIRRKQRRALQQEIDELRRFESDSSR